MEVPSNLILKPLTPQRYIAFISFAWGYVLASDEPFLLNGI